MLSVLSYNIFFGKRLPQIIDWINERPNQFDIICFQEFPLDYLKEFSKVPMANQYEFRTALSFNHKKKAYGQITLINKRKIQLLQTDTLFLKTSFLEEQVLDFSGGRSALITKLKYNGISSMLVNTHLVAYGSNNQRRAQITKIVTYFEHDIYKNTPIVILGDLNYSSLIGQKKLIELMQAYKFRNAYKLNTHKLFNFKDHQIDYLFYKNIQVGHIKMHNLSFSDHQLITFDIELLGKSSEE